MDYGGQAKFVMLVVLASVVVLVVAVSPAESRLQLVMVVTGCELFMLWALWQVLQEADKALVERTLTINRLQAVLEQERALKKQVEQELSEQVRRLELKVKTYQDWERRERAAREQTEQKLREVWAAESEQVELDDMARKILELLRQTPSLTDTEIGKAVGLSRQAVNVQKRVLRGKGLKWW
jgi:hypothetical protein